MAALLVAGCSSSTGSAGSPSTAPPPQPSAGTTLTQAVPSAVADLTFTDDQGRSVSLASLHGKAVVLADFLTLCQEICPLTSANLNQVVQAANTAGLSQGVDVVQLTVDPARDTPARLAAYRALFHAPANWLFWTGSAENVAAVWKQFGVSYDKVAEDDPAHPPADWLTGQPLTYDINHTDAVFLLDPTGNERWVDQGTPDTKGVKPPPTLETFLNDNGRANVASPPAPTWTVSDVTRALSWVTGHPVTAP